VITLPGSTQQGIDHFGKGDIAGAIADYDRALKVPIRNSRKLISIAAKPGEPREISTGNR